MENASSNLKRVVITRNAYSWQYGGAEQFAFNLAHSLRGVGVEAVVVSRVPELLKHCQKAHIPTFKNIWLKNETHRRWMPLYYILFPLLITQYIWVLWRERADLLIATSRDDQIFGTMAAKILGVPVVWFDHADMKHIVAVKFRFLSKSYYWALDHAQRIVMPSKAEFVKVSQKLNKMEQSKFTVITNGAIKGSGQALEKPAGKKIVAYVGRIDREKGLFDLAEAAAEVSKDSDVEFWLAGKGPDEKELTIKAQELGISTQFKLLGHMENVWGLLLAADVFVYPTHHDAAPLAPAEAILAGVPVVASKVGGIPEIVPSTAGVLVPPCDPEKLAAAIEELLGNATKLKGLKGGAEAAASELDFEIILKKHYLPLFRSVAREAV